MLRVIYFLLLLLFLALSSRVHRPLFGSYLVARSCQSIILASLIPLQSVLVKHSLLELNRHDHDVPEVSYSLVMHKYYSEY